MACGGTTQLPILRRRLAHCSKAAAAFACLILALAVPSAAAPAAPAPVKTTLTVTTNDGYARLVFTAGEYIDGTARQAGNVLIISFKQPLDVAVKRVPEQAPDYIGAARRDPDGTAVRMALAQNVTVHAMSAGEKFFVDLLPTSWSGMPPGLPQDVVDELARRAREAERLLARQRTAVQEKKSPPIRVHMASQPTFTRYVFAVPSETGVSADRAKERLVLKFDSPLTFDLGDVQAALPKTVQEISSELDQDSSLVRFIVGANADTRTFRDEFGLRRRRAQSAGRCGCNRRRRAAKCGRAGRGAEPRRCRGENLGGGSSARRPAVARAAAAAVGNNSAGWRPPPRPAATPSPAPTAAPPPAPTAQMAPPPAKTAVVPDVEAQPVAPGMTPALSPAPPAVPPADWPPVHGALPPSSDTAQTRPPAAPVAAPPKIVAATPETAQPSAPQIVKPTALEIAKPDTPKPAAAASASPQPAPPEATPAPPIKSSAAAPPPPTAPADGDSAGNVAADLSQQGADLKLTFAFKTPVGAAVFQRADTLWLVFDSKAKIDLSALDGEPSRTIRAFEFSHSGAADVVRLKLDRPRLSSVAADGGVWTVNIGDTVIDPTHALDLTRNLIGANRSSVSIPFENAKHVYQIADPDVGDRLFVVTALGAGARHHRRAGSYRIPCAAFDPGRGDRAARRRPQRDACSR